MRALQGTAYGAQAGSLEDHSLCCLSAYFREKKEKVLGLYDWNVQQITITYKLQLQMVWGEESGWVTGMHHF